jgi:ABC-type nickel/cobalt efflux system permease component RcnA
MNSAALTTIAATGFTVAFFHAVLPTHWLPFVLAARARGWSTTKTLTVTTFAGLGHIAITTLLGVAIAWFGFRLNEQVGRAFPWIAGGALVAIGIYYFVRQLQGRGICHHAVPGSHHHASEACGHEQEHSHWEHEVEESELVSERRSDLATIGGLLLMLTLSPCEGFLPVYLSGVRFGWHGFVVLSAILAVATLAGMTLVTWLALRGLERFRVRAFEKWEAGAIGMLFCVIGVLVVVVEH